MVWELAERLATSWQRRAAFGTSYWVLRSSGGTSPRTAPNRHDKVSSRSRPWSLSSALLPGDAMVAPASSSEGPETESPQAFRDFAAPRPSADFSLLVTPA